jgi:cytochrome c-type biogenesis protein
MVGTEVQISWLLAFLAGIVSFISPCVLPLIPGYVSLVTKQSFEDITERRNSTVKSILIPSLFFVFGFSTLFVLLGASASYIGNFFQQYKLLLLKISGIAVIIFSLFVLELINIPQLYRERKININNTNLGYISPFLLGIAFGFGWTPCVGPILASILLYASTSEGASEGALLLFIYSFGLGLPFIITGIALSKAFDTFSWIKRNYGAYKYITGLTLMLVGILMLTNSLFYINIYGQKILDTVGLDFWKSF